MVPATSGSTTKSFTGMFGKSVVAGVMQFGTEQLTSLHVAPRSVVLKMCPVGSFTVKLLELATNANPENAAYAVCPVVSAGSPAIADTVLGGKLPCPGTDCIPFPDVTSLVTKICPFEIPAYNDLEFVGATASAVIPSWLLALPRFA